MESIEDIKQNKRKIEDCIKKYGFSAEHNYYNFLALQKKDWEPLFFLEKDYGVMAFINNNKIKIISEILAPENKRQEVLLNFLDYCFLKRKVKKVIVEFEEDFREKLLKDLKNYKALNINYILYWPLFNMKEFDTKLTGKKLKKLRNIYNRYKNNQDLKITNFQENLKNESKQLVLKWVKQRRNRNRTDYHFFLNQIENNFNGCDETRIIIIKNKVVAITAGWSIPNSKNYYSAIGVYDYDYNDIGEFANIDDLINLKEKGYEWVDFGGSEQELLKFKEKFGFSKVYKTYIFSIVKT